MSMQHHPGEADGRQASVTVIVSDAGGSHAVVVNASIAIYRATPPAKARTAALYEPPADATLFRRKRTVADGSTTFDGLDKGWYLVAYEHEPQTAMQWLEVPGACRETLCFEPAINASVQTVVQSDDCQPLNCRAPRVNDNIVSTVMPISERSATPAAGPGWPPASRLGAPISRAP